MARTIAYIQYPPGNGVGTLMTMSSDGSNKQPVLVHGAEVTTTIAVTWAPTADIAATKADGALAVVAGLDCGSGYRQYGIYLIKVDGSCTTVARNPCRRSQTSRL